MHKKKFKVKQQYKALKLIPGTLCPLNVSIRSREAMADRVNYAEISKLAHLKYLSRMLLDILDMSNCQAPLRTCKTYLTLVGRSKELTLFYPCHTLY